MLVLAVLGVALAVGLGPAWTGLMIYVSVASPASLPRKWVWPAVLGSAAVAVAVVAADGLLGDLFILPLMCVLSAFALLGTRTLVAVNAELAEAREELARTRGRRGAAALRPRPARPARPQPVADRAQERARRPAGRARPRPRARQELADIEAAARQALAEVREAVSGYRQLSLAQALAEARSALSAAGIALRRRPRSTSLPGRVDAVLGWAVREAITNVLRHSGAATVHDRPRSAADDGVALEIADDGRGAAAPRGGRADGLAERVQRLRRPAADGPAATGSGSPPASDCAVPTEVSRLADR